MNFITFDNLKIKLDIDSKDRVIDFGFEISGSDPKQKRINDLQFKYLKITKKIVLDQNINDIISFDTLDFVDELLTDKNFIKNVTEHKLPIINIPFWMIRKLIKNYKGDPKPHFKLKNQMSNDLICRCLGIYKKEILDALSDPTKKYAKIEDLLNDLNLAVGCGSCLKDVEVIWKKFSQENQLDQFNKVEFANKIQNLINEWVVNIIESNKKMYIEVYDINKYEVILKISANDQNLINKIKSDISSYLLKSIDEKLKIGFV